MHNLHTITHFMFLALTRSLFYSKIEATGQQRKRKRVMWEISPLSLSLSLFFLCECGNSLGWTCNNNNKKTNKQHSKAGLWHHFAASAEHAFPEGLPGDGPDGEIVPARPAVVGEALLLSDFLKKNKNNRVWLCCRYLVCVSCISVCVCVLCADVCIVKNICVYVFIDIYVDVHISLLKRQREKHLFFSRGKRLVGRQSLLHVLHRLGTQCEGHSPHE